MAKIEEADVGQLVSDINNANRGTARGREMLRKSVADYGAGRSILVDKNGVVIAGNKTRQAMADAGMTRALVVETDGSQLVVVKRTDLDLNDRKGKARKLAYADNRVGQIDLEWDPEVVLADMAEGVEMGDFFSEKELKKITDTVRVEPHEDDAPSLPDEPKSRLGDIYVMGGHRLVCGDCTQHDVVKAALGSDDAADMLWSDPPWNVAYVGKTKDAKTIKNDDLGEAFPAFAEAFAATFACALRPGHVIYVAMGSSEWPVLDAALRKSGFHWSSTIIWAKDSLVLSRKDYHPQYEPIWYGWLDGAPRRYEVTDRTQSDLWEVARPKRSAEHPTMKPVELVARAIQNSSAPGDLVFDPFGGSGTTLIACEQTRRRCATIELDPRYVDVIVTRWEALTGKQAELIRDGQTAG